MERNRFEETYLLLILKAVMRDKKVPIAVRRVNWENIFRLADFHNVANVVYYGLLGYADVIPSPWRRRFSDKYKEAVLEYDRLGRESEKISSMLEEMKIHHVLLNGSVINRCYRLPEMRYWDCIAILAGPGTVARIEDRLKRMDYEEESGVEKGRMFYRIPGLRIVFYERLFFAGRSIKRYYNNVLNRLELEEGKRYTHRFTVEEYYVYLLCFLIDSYARGNIELRYMLDLWAYDRHYYEEINWMVVDRAMKQMKADDFGSHLELMNYLWFDRGITEETEVYEAMEAYILTKGTEGREISEKLFPLVKHAEDFYRRNRRKEWRRKKVRWMFPRRDYMEELYPFLKEHGYLLCFCWIHRFFRSLWTQAKRVTGTQYKKFIQPPIDKLRTIFQKLHQRMAALMERIRGTARRIGSHLRF